jgi:thiamine biosynthesis protein ThiS
MNPVTASALEIVVNGQARTAPPGATVESFLRAHDLDPALVVVERNGEILARPAFAATALEPGDRLEIVHFVGGG